MDIAQDLVRLNRTQRIVRYSNGRKIGFEQLNNKKCCRDFENIFSSMMPAVLKVT